MPPFLKGPAPFAIILCTFNDDPIPNIPKSQFFNFISQSGRGGLYDYWRDISYGQIDLAGSEVFGWYTTKHSFIRDGIDPLKNGTQGRFAWIAEAIRLAGANGVDLSRFYGIVVAVNANGVDDSNAGRNTVPQVGGSWGQSNWKWCNKCQGLAFAGNASLGNCPAGQFHDHTGSGNYALALNDAAFPGQDGWKWCNKCQGLCFAGHADLGPCPNGGKHDHIGSGDYRLGQGSVGYKGQNQWKWCGKCQGLSFSGDSTQGACPGGGVHDHAGSGDYTLVVNGSDINDTFKAPETGHCYGLSHSWFANPDVEYGGQWVIMSAIRIKTFDDKIRLPEGLGINAPTLQRLGWLSDDRIFTFRVSSLSSASTVKLVALSRPEHDGYLMARVLTPNHVYTVEFRRPSGWDTGIGKDAVFINELRSNYTTGQRNWLWCNKCQGLTYAGNAICPAGAVHDHSQSGNYSLAWDGSGQQEWRWCKKCQALSFTGRAGDNGACPAGGVHDTSASANYGLQLNSNAQGQQDWKWCCKCQGLTYSANSTLGACSVGGVHDHSGSGFYTLALGSSVGQDQWRWCSKCQGLAYDGYSVCAAGGAHSHAGSGDYSLALNDSSAPGQDKWMWCSKCYGLAFAGNPSPGPCPAKGNHDHSGSGNYTLLSGVGSDNGQNKWSWCNKCQLLAFAGNGNAPCPAGGDHDYSGSGDYTLANFGADRSFLIQADWQPGQVFTDAARAVQISIGAIDSVAGTVTVTIGSPPKSSHTPVAGDSDSSSESDGGSGPGRLSMRRQLKRQLKEVINRFR